ncbi:MAG: SpoIIE family protein phosphatase [Spirochaetaceae bacterium]|jgi:serine phosphatase RsbU (regulator of sigma subunit)|nr:SpoIIE family protein phosphatase [Spirochaetaceae bacterium]
MINGPGAEWGEAANLFPASGGFVFNGVILLVPALILLCLACAVFLARVLARRLADRAVARAQAEALLRGTALPGERKQLSRRVRRNGARLPFKLSSFTAILVLFLVVVVSLPLFLWMTRSRRELLFEGLRGRAALFIESTAASCRVPLLRGDAALLGELPDRYDSLPEARWVTVTEITEAGGVYGERLWASNDPDIALRIDTPEPGVSRFSDGLSPRLGEILREAGAAASEPPFDSGIPESTGALLRDLFNYARSGPAPAENRRYLFYGPVRDGALVLGLVRAEVDTGLLLEEIRRRRQDMLVLILATALTAAVIGITGALLLSRLVIVPIRRLVNHVELIRDTENMAALDGVDLRIRSRDELALLGNTINDMTKSLVRAAQASEDLTIGKELQKKFIPLEADREGNKLTTGFRETPQARFFGYYEGAKGVSGDYFDYQDLDGRYYAVIKCDVAGKGVPAALIMIQVATMFLNYFNDWRADEEGMHIEKAVYQINEFIEALGFTGRFAAFALCLFDSRTGLLRFCNAGDNVVHWYDASERKMKKLTLRESPAAGILSNDIVDSRGGYTVQSMKLDRGDILFLYTDGIEESKRSFRDERGREIRCNAGGLHGNHRAGDSAEEMGRERVEAIINAVMNRERFRLRKYHAPRGGADFEFDFSSCSGEVDEAVLALASAEKVFRLYRRGAENAGEGSYRVPVDRRVDQFLRRHLVRYETYSRSQAENPGYLYYNGISEDPQYDDIAILGIRRK